jgi:glucose/arabinose dehydrogenase
MSIRLLSAAVPVFVLALATGCGEPARPVEPASKPPPSAVAVELLLQGHPLVPNTPVALALSPATAGFFVLGRDGDLFHYDRPIESFDVTTEGAAPRIASYPGVIKRQKIDGSFAWGDLGTLGLALDPEFADNRFLYVWYCDKGDDNVALDRFTWSPVTSRFAASRRNVIRFSRRDPPAPYHMGGIVQFLPDGTLLIGSGDAERPALSQDRMDLNGKLLRIRPRRTADGGYDVPPDNPHVGEAGWRPEIVATGLRAPFRAWLRNNGHLWFGDVGAVHEEINVWLGGPVDFGWGHGDISDGPGAPPGTAKPVITWNLERDFAAEDPEYNGEARLSAGVGVVYEPAGGDRYRGLLTGKLVFFEIMRGWIRAGIVTDDGRIESHAHVGHRQFVSDLEVASDGYVYGVTWARPESIFRLRLADEVKPAPRQPAPRPTSEPPLPPRADVKPRGN